MPWGSIRAAKIGERKQQKPEAKEQAPGHLRLWQRNGHLGQEAPTLFRNEEALTALGSGTPRSEWGDKEYFADMSFKHHGAKSQKMFFT